MLGVRVPPGLPFSSDVNQDGGIRRIWWKSKAKEFLPEVRSRDEEGQLPQQEGRRHDGRGDRDQLDLRGLPVRGDWLIVGATSGIVQGAQLVTDGQEAGPDRSGTSSTPTPVSRSG